MQTNPIAFATAGLDGILNRIQIATAALKNAESALSLALISKRHVTDRLFWAIKVAFWKRQLTILSQRVISVQAEIDNYDEAVMEHAYSEGF
jgi:hypothetical protein